MTPEKALYKFYNSFGIPAYPETSVPEDAGFPRITYDFAVGSFDDPPVYLTANVWYKTESESIPTEKAAEIGNAIGFNGVMLPIDGGAIWLTRGSPFLRTVPDDDDTIKRRCLNITAEFFTA